MDDRCALGEPMGTAALRGPATADPLGQLCQDLRLLRDEAGGPSLRALATEIGLGKSQVGAILSGTIRRPPDWTVVRGLVGALYRCARDRGRWQRLSINAGLDEYWRARHALVEHAYGAVRQVRDDATEVDPGMVVPRQLPPATPHFVGRNAELALLDAAAEQSAAPLVVTGMAGVGKTSLAIAWAHRAAHRFPDGQLYLDLRGFDPSGPVMTPAEAVRALLEMLAVPHGQVPPGFQAQVGLYRSLLSERRVLLLLDNARDADQVRAFLAASSTCRVLVTSRVELTGLVAAHGAYPIALDVLTDLEARDLLARRLGRRRVAAEPAAVDRLVAACGRLPMALAVAAARAVTRPDFPLAAVADGAGLGTPYPGDSGVDVRAVFSWSYRALSPGAARLLRLLGRHAGPDVGTPAAASLAGVAGPTVAAPLAELTRAHLVTEVRPGRYGFHDLLRAYATERAAADDAPDGHHAARLRLLDHYLHTAYAAALLVSPRRTRIVVAPAVDGVTPERLDGRDGALRWFAEERTALLAAARYASASGDDTRTWQLAWSLADVLELRGHFDDWITAQTLGVAAALRLQDPEPLLVMLITTGNAYSNARRYDNARRHPAQSDGLAERLGDRVRLARARLDER